MPPVADYRLVVTDVNNNQLDEIPFPGNLMYGYGLNEAGNIDFVIPIDHPKAVKDGFLDPGRANLYLYRNGVLVWSGRLWTASVTLGADQIPEVRFHGEGWYSIFDRRFIDSRKAYTAQDQAAILWDLIQYTQAKTGGDLGITQGVNNNTGLTMDVTWTGYDRTTLEDAFRQIVEQENGMDFEITAARVFNGFATKGATLTEPLEMGKNMSSFAWDIDASNSANYISALGAGEGSQMCVANAVDTTWRTNMGLLEESVSATDVIHFTHLQRIANKQLKLDKKARSQPTIAAILDTQAPGGYAWGGIVTGDTVPVRIGYGYAQLNRSFRVLNVQYALSNEGREACTIYFDES